MADDITQAFSKNIKEMQTRKFQSTKNLQELFGYSAKDPSKEADEKRIESFVPKEDEDAALTASGGAYGTFVDLEGKAKGESQLITKYREMANQPECDMAIQDILNEAIITDNNESPVKIVLDDVEGLSSGLKTKINDEFEYCLNLLNFRSSGYDIFKKWYIDGRIYYHMAIDVKSPKKGIQEVRNVDPRRLKKVRVQKKDKKEDGTIIYKGKESFYVYYQQNYQPGFTAPGTKVVKIAEDCIASSHSGIMSEKNTMIYSNLQKAIKPLNQLRMLEDAVVIYRLSRAPERRIFYIDVGNLPKMKAEQHLRDMMAKHKNKIVYDATTGEVRDDRKFMTMMEDFWLPRRGDGKATEITTLPGGQNLGEMDDVEYFKKKLYKSLNVPVTRLEPENNFNLGRSSEIGRDELKFSKFIIRLRNQFTRLFDNMLEIQLALKGIMSRSDWKKFRKDIYYNFLEDNHYAELKDTEVWRERMSLLGEIDGFKGVYFSEAWIRKNILRFTDEEVKEQQKLMDKEAEEQAKIEQAKIEQEQAANNPEPEAPPTPSFKAVPTDQEPEGDDQGSAEPAPTKKPQGPDKKAKKAPSGPNEEISFVSDKDRELVENFTKVLDDYIIEEDDEDDGPETL